MAIHLVCPGCRTRFKVSEKYAGKKGPCPKCKKEIQVPHKEDHVVIKAPDFSGESDAEGKPVLKPIPRVETKVTPLAIVGIVLAILVVFGSAFGIRMNYAADEIPLITKVLAAMALAPLLAWLGYSFLRDSELEPYRGTSLTLRIAICAMIYAMLWGGYTWSTQFFFGDSPMEAWNVIMLAIPFLFVGGLAAFASLDLDPTSAFFHYSFYLTVTVLLRLTTGMTAF